MLARLSLIATVAIPGAAASADADTDPETPAASELARSLAELPALDATELACELALSDDERYRATLAHSMEWLFPLAGDDVILEHLAHDDSSLVRAATARAALARRAHDVTVQLTADPAEEVRRAADGRDR